MFTGIITDVGTIRDATPSSGGLDLVIAANWDDLEIGESVATDGACLTVTAHGDGWFAVHVITTSLERTHFASDLPGRRVNLERALRVGDRFGGHFVQGHVDGLGIVATVATRDDARLLEIRAPVEVASVTVPLGSIAVDGVSLTVNAIPAAGVIQVSLIPFTLEHTNLGDRVAGDAVHLEGDSVGKYLKQLSAAWSVAGPR